MAPSCDVKLKLNKPKSDDAFTSNDIISGVAILTVKDSLSLKNITVKLEGISTTQIMVPRQTKRGKEVRERFVTDEHKLLYKSSVVFPPDHVQKVSQAKEFTLTPGTYTYPFEFQIPMYSACDPDESRRFPKMYNVSPVGSNMNMAFIRDSVNSLRDGVSNFRDQMQSRESNHIQSYHVQEQLPPSFKGPNFANISYFVKVTCKRSSMLKANLRNVRNFYFLPLDPYISPDPQGPGKQMFSRKEIIFRGRVGSPSGFDDKAPPLPARRDEPPLLPRRMGIFSRKFDFSSSSASKQNRSGGTDVPFAFEVRFPNPPTVTPGSIPAFRMFLVSPKDPRIYSAKDGSSNGLGVVYLQRLSIQLISTTHGSVLTTVLGEKEIHRANHTETVPLCGNVYENLQFDLKDCSHPKSDNYSAPGRFELEIPPEHFRNSTVPKHVIPSFETCNIARNYVVVIRVGFSSESLINCNDEREAKLKTSYVELYNDIRVLSGKSMGNASTDGRPNYESQNYVGHPPSFEASKASSDQLTAASTGSQVYNSGAAESVSDQKDSETNDENYSSLPTYDDAVQYQGYQESRR